MSTVRCRNCDERIDEDEGVWGVRVRVPYMMDIHCREAVNGLHRPPWTRTEVILGLVMVYLGTSEE
jgi:hypothetical protein